MIVKGELSIEAGGLAQVAECGTTRVFTLGVMASNPYFGLTQRYAEAADNRKFTVLVEIEGSIAEGAGTERTFVSDSPSVVSLVRGTCADPRPNTSLERTHER
jgi:hypothetical protein